MSGCAACWGICRWRPGWWPWWPAGTRPPWASAAVAAIPDAFVDTRPVGSLAAVDALAYLEKSGVEGEPLREALAGYAAVGPGEVHPYFLGLCADVALAAQRRGDRLDPRA